MSSTDRITITCNCGKRLHAPAAAVGRKAKCPNCGNVLTVAAPAAQAVPVAAAAKPKQAPTPRQPSAESVKSLVVDGVEDAPDEMNALYAMADQEAAAGAQAEAEMDAAAPAPSAPTIVSTSRGKLISIQPQTGDDEAEDDGTPSRLPPLVMGSIVCFGAALAAGVVWFIIAYASRNEYSYFVAMLVGAAAGVGMRKGLKDESIAAGLIAAGITLIVSVATRAIVIQTVTIPAENHAAQMAYKEKLAERDAHQRQLAEQEAAERDPRVAQMISDQELRAQGIDPEKKYDDQAINRKISESHLRAIDKLHSMTPEEYEKYVPAVEAIDVREVLIGAMQDPQLRKMGLNPDFQRIYPEQHEAARKAVLEQVNKMSPQEQRAELKKVAPHMLEAMESERARRRAQYELAAPNANEQPPKPVGGADAVMERLTSFLPILITLLAMCAAFRTASGTVIT